jgi:hypothetical protein
MKKIQFSLLILLFVGLFLGSCALYQEMKNKQDHINRTDSPNIEEQIESDVVLTVPVINTVISSPVTISGKARGNWFFEASLPIEIIDSTGKVLGQGPAQAQSNWMTADYVDFLAEISFNVPETEKGFILIKKDNPSGLPEYDASIAIPVFFK